MKANTDTLQKQEEEKSFQYRSYGKGELAMLYIQRPATKRSRPLQRMDRSRTRTKRTLAIHRHESPKQTLHTRTSTTDRRSAAGALKTGNKYCCQSAVKTK